MQGSERCEKHGACVCGVCTVPHNYEPPSGCAAALPRQCGWCGDPASADLQMAGRSPTQPALGAPTTQTHTQSSSLRQGFWAYI